MVGPASLAPNVILMHPVFDIRDGIINHVQCAVLVYPGGEAAGLYQVPEGLTRS